MMAVLLAIVGVLGSALRSRASLVAENLALRQQLAVLRVGCRSQLRPIDRAFLGRLRNGSPVREARGPSGRFGRYEGLPGSLGSPRDASNWRNDPLRRGGG
jgi:hypothetical protein